MAATMAHMPSTPVAGPSSNPLSRAASASSSVRPESDSEEEWLGSFREEVRRNREQQLTTLLRQAESEYRRQSSLLVARRGRPDASDGLTEEAYQVAKAKLDRAFELRKQKIPRLLDEEERTLIERERDLRKLSLGQLSSEEAQELIREQDALLKMYQAQAHRSDAPNAHGTETASIPPTFPQQQAWIPPARPLSSQKSNASTTSSVRQVRRASNAVPQTSANLTEDLFPKRSRHDSRGSTTARYAPWELDVPDSSASVIYQEPEGVSESDSDEERDSDNADEKDGESEEGDNDGDDNLYMGSYFMLSAESSFKVPSKPPPMNIARSSTRQPSTRGRSRVVGRTPPPATATSFQGNTTPLRQQSQKQSLSRNNSDTQHRLWNPRPSTENIRPPNLTRRPSFADPATREKERTSEAERSWTEYENGRTRNNAIGALGTSASPPTHVSTSASFGAASAATFSQIQRSTETPAKIWKPRENQASIPMTSNVHVMASSSGTSNSSNASPMVGAKSYRRRNDSDTSAGSSARWPSQPQTQSFAKTERTSLPINTPGISASRRSPIPGSDLYTTSSSSPPISTSFSPSARRSPYGHRPPSPPPSQIPSGAAGLSLSRQPTEIIEPASTRQENRANKVLPRVNSRLRIAEKIPDSEPGFERLGSRSFNDRSPRPPSTSALTERLREHDSNTDSESEEQEKNVGFESDRSSKRGEQHRERDAELSERISSYDSNAVETQRRIFEEQQTKLREELLEAQRAAQEKVARDLREELLAAQRAREAEFAEQKRILEAQRQREAELRMQKERLLTEKEEELSKHKREMEEWLRWREEHEIAEQTRQLETLKKKEAILEEQQHILEEQRRLELEEQRKREEELKQKVEELKRQQRELAEQQRRKEEREQEEARRRQEEEALAAEQRRKEDELRAREEELRKKKWEIQQREEELARRRKAEELLAKEEALERQRKELEQREEELARREEEDERRRKKEEQARKEREAAQTHQQEEDKKRVEVHMRKVLAQEHDRGRERKERERQMVEKEERERERRERDERSRRMQREWDEERRKQEEYEQRAKDTERRKREEADRLSAEEIKDQEELLRFFENRKRGAASFSSSIPNSAAAFSSAAGAFHSGRAASSTSSIHSNWSQRSSASSASSAAASDFSRASAGSSASSAWSSSTRPTTASAGSSNSSRTTTGESHKTASGTWKTAGAAGSGTGPSPSGAGMGSYTSSSPLSEAEWRRRQEENARRQQEQFRKESLRQEQERAAQAAAAATSSAGGREQIQRAWAIYDSSWASLKERPVLYFRTMPWPVLRAPSTPEDLTTNAICAFVLSPAHSTDKSNRDRLKAELLRWHPDRFESKWLTKVDEADKDTVRSAAGQVVRALNELMARENNDPFG